MWTLKKPDIKEAFNDIKAVIAASGGMLVAGDEPRIRRIYQAYDDNGGTISKALNNSMCVKQRKSLQSLYSLTYPKNGRPDKLYFIRKGLFGMVDECPMCGMHSPQQLDHQMPKSDYETLAVFRHNLVPVCSTCNNKKRKKNASDFVHPYYAVFPKDVAFLVARVDVDSDNCRVSWVFDIEGEGLKNEKLLEQINNQVTVIELFDRLSKASNNYLSEILYRQFFYNDEQLKYFLRWEYDKNLDLYKLNHWRTALISALLQKESFNYQVANHFVKNIRPVNNGYGA